MQIKIITTFLLLTTSSSFAWQQRGHDTITSIAAVISYQNYPQHTFLKTYNYNLGYYSVVPDTIFKVRNSKEEFPLHFFEWSSKYEKVFGTPQNIPEKHSAFKKKMASGYKSIDGLLFWRISTLTDRCKKLAKPEKMTKNQLQQLVICMGVLSHYTADLSMPLHTTDNHDGQLTGQSGLHSFLEGPVFKELLIDSYPQIKTVARAQLEKIKSKRPSPARATRDLFLKSHQRINPFLAFDKKVGRKQISKIAQKYKPLIIEYMADGVALTSYIWESILKDAKPIKQKGFLNIKTNPQYLKPRFI